MSTQPSNSVIRAIKQSIYERLATNAYFATIPGLVVIPKDIFSQISQGVLPIGSGIAFFVEAFVGGPSDKGLPGPYYEGGRITVTIVEQPTLNNLNPDCDEVSETAQRLIQQFAPNDGLESCWVSDPSEVENDTLSIRRFYVNIPVGFKPIVLPAMPPIVITPNGGSGLAYPLAATLALQTPVPGAAIFYTLDGSFPAPLNPAAVLYQPQSPLQLSDDRQLQLQDGETIMIGGSVAILSARTLLSARAYLASYNAGADTQAFFN